MTAPLRPAAAPTISAENALNLVPYKRSKQTVENARNTSGVAGKQQDCRALHGRAGPPGLSRIHAYFTILFR